jgi:hypothetical protein
LLLSPLLDAVEIDEKDFSRKEPYFFRPRKFLLFFSLCSLPSSAELLEVVGLCPGGLLMLMFAMACVGTVPLGTGLLGRPPGRAIG